MEREEVAKSLDLLAHKIKNPLHSATINLEVLRVKLRKQGIDRESLKHLEIADTELQRVKEIILKYLEYLRLPDAERTRTSLTEILE